MENIGGYLKMQAKSLFIFRRGLRLEDNTGLLKALEENETVIPAFIMDDRQLQDNEYYSENAAEFMKNSLEELDEELRKRGSRLYVFEGKPHSIVEHLIEDEAVDSVYLNHDYTPFSKKRDKKIRLMCRKHDVAYNAYHDYVLNKPTKVFTNAGTPYKVFTPYWKKARKHDVPQAKKNDHKNFYDGDIKDSDTSKIEKFVDEPNPNLFRQGGRHEGLEILEKVGKHDDYSDDREYPWKDGTTGLSPHNKFGTVSIREVYHSVKEALGEDSGIIQELYWRDFYTQLAYHFPKVFHKSLKEKYEDVEWDENEEAFQAWKEGKTGFPIVDAGMRQLNKTGWMHNRVRMIVACFLTKDLHIHWKEGERYFAQHLVDYDPCVNNGSWQWAASTGADAQPYFRVFNPWTQQEDYDKDCDYIKKYVPELQDYPAEAIHSLNEQRPVTLSKDDYPEPIVDHKEEREDAIARFKEVS